MKKKFSLLLLVLALVVAMGVPAFAGYDYEEVDDGVYEVTFYYEGAPDADVVYVAGDMNDWSASHPDWEMERVDGRWELTTELEEAAYAYKFTVNGSDWTTDKQAEQFADDGVGGENSVLSLLDTSLPGELNLSGEITNEVTFNSDEELDILNEAVLRANGQFHREIEDENGEVVDTEPIITYDGTVAVIQDIADFGSGRTMEEVGLDEISLEELNVTYLHDWADFSFTANKAGESSYDYMGLVNSLTVSDLNDSRRFNIDANKWVDANASITALTGDITDSDEVDRVLGTADIKESFMDDKLEVGSSVAVDSGYDGTAEEAPYVVESASLFGQYDIMEGLNVRGEVAHIPTNDGIEWYVSFDPDAEENEDIMGSLDKDDIEVAVLGDVADGWGDDGNKFKEDRREMTLNDEDEFKAYVPGAADGEEYKVVIINKNKADWDDAEWNGDLEEDGYTDIGLEGEEHGDNMELGHEDAEDYFVRNFNKDDFDTGNMYLAEVNYDIVDENESLKQSIKAGDEITAYKAKMNAGIEGIAADAFVPLANDSLNDIDNFDKTDIFANAEYNVTSDITATVDALYQKDYEFDKDKEIKFEPAVDATLLDDALEVSSSFLFLDEIDEDNEDTDEIEAANRKFKVDATWDQPIAELNHVTANLKVDTEDEDDFDGQVQEVFVETETGIVPFTHHISVNTNQYLDAGVSNYYAETSLDIPVEQIDYVDAEVFYAMDDASETDDEQAFEDGNAMKYKLSGSLHHLPVVSDYITHLTGEFEADADGIIDHGNYDDDDNDWKNKIAASTMLDVPMVEDFHGLTIEADMLNIEEGAKDASDLDEDLNAKYAVEGQVVEWYNTLTLLTGYDFSDDARVNVTHKVGLNHSDFISKYEDDALKVEFTQEFNQYSTMNASVTRNGDGGEYEDTVEVSHELTF